MTAASRSPDAPGVPPAGSPPPPDAWGRVAVVVPAILLALAGYLALESWVLLRNADPGTLRALRVVRGIAIAVALAGTIAWYLLHRRILVYPSRREDDIEGHLDLEERDRQHVAWFIHMRWIAIALTLVLVLIAVPLTGVLPPDSLLPLGAWWTAMLLGNLVFATWARRGRRLQTQILVQAVTDVLILTGLLNASGGIENPLYLAYLFHSVIAGILLPKPKALVVTLAASVLFGGLVVGEYTGALEHREIRLSPHSLGSAEEGAEFPTGPSPARDAVFVMGEALTFLAVLYLTAFLTILMAERLHESERYLESVARTARMERRRLESVLHAAGVGMVVVGPGGGVQWFSQRIREWFGDAAETGCAPAVPAGPAGESLAARSFRTGRTLDSERRVEAPGGGVRYFRHSTSPVRDREGRIVQVVELVEDVTGRKAIEAEAMHGIRLATLGRIAAGIAHEIGNPLSSLSTRLHLVERRRDPEFVGESLVHLRAQIDRIARIVHGVSHFARIRPEEWTTWDLKAALEEAVGVVRMDRRAAQVRFALEIPPAPVGIRGVRDQMVQVFLNLLLNAVEAMPGGGAIRVEIVRRDGEVEVAIADTGPGIEDSTRRRLFEPFFTTKPEGTGLGLAICDSLVHSHGGRIEVTSEPGSGSCFRVVLPAVEADGGGAAGRSHR